MADAIVAVRNRRGETEGRLVERDSWIVGVPSRENIRPVVLLVWCWEVTARLGGSLVSETPFRSIHCQTCFVHTTRGSSPDSLKHSIEVGAR